MAQANTSTIWDKLSRVIILLIGCAIAVIILLCFLPGTQQKQRMLNDIQSREALIQKEEETARNLNNSIRTLQSDPKAVERLARQAGYAKPGETVVRFEDPATNAVPGR